MAKEQKTTLWSRSTDTLGKRLLIAVVIVVGLPLIAYGIAQFGYQQRINSLSSAINDVWEQSIQTQGGTKEKSSTTCPNVYQTWAIGINDVGPCPDYYTRFTVAIEQGKESSFLTDILSKNGYTANVPAQAEYKLDTPFVGGGIKGNVGLNMSLSPLTDQRYSLSITATEASR
jgi:hypothetical protein